MQMSKKSIKEEIEYLKIPSSKTGKNAYDEITNMVARLLDNRSQNPETLDCTYFMKDLFIQSNKDSINNQWAKESIKVFDDMNKNNNEDFYYPNFLETSYYFEQAGLGLSQEETFKIFLSLRKLCVSYPKIEDIRFWGKIFGIEKNYYIIEARADDDLNTSCVKFKLEHQILNEANRTISSPIVNSLPQINESKLITPSEINSGCNKFQYYVTYSRK
jgi:radial spoke head protein 4/6